MSRALNPDQQKEIQVFQQMSQQLSILQQNYVQMETRKREIGRTLDALQDLKADHEVYNAVGQILFKTNAGKTTQNLKEQLEILEIQVTKSKKQAEEFEKRVKDKESQIRQSIQP